MRVGVLFFILFCVTSTVFPKSQTGNSEGLPIDTLITQFFLNKKPVSASYISSLFKQGVPLTPEYGSTLSSLEAVLIYGEKYRGGVIFFILDKKELKNIPDTPHEED